VLFLSLFLYTADAWAVFEALDDAGKTIFKGLRSIIYPASTIGIACVCIGGMFGNFNWKWLVAIMLGIFVISYAAETTQLTGASIEGLD
jgi:type IV secretory pathway VirB2 component (pilin)